MKEIGFIVRSERMTTMLEELRDMAAQKKFWDVVEACGWGTKTTNCKVIKKYLMDNYSLKEIEELDAQFRIHQDALHQRLDNVTGVSDDGFDDLISHIIGLGKKEYDAVMKDPGLAQKRIDRSDYMESFSYVWPNSHDYEKRDGDRLFKWAKDIATAYSSVTQLPPQENDIFSEYILPKVRNDVELVAKVAEAFSVSHNAPEFLAHKEEVVEAVSRVERHLRKIDLCEDNETNRALENIKSPYWVINLFNDAAEFLT